MFRPGLMPETKRLSFRIDNNIFPLSELWAQTLVNIMQDGQRDLHFNDCHPTGARIAHLWSLATGDAIWQEPRNLFYCQQNCFWESTQPVPGETLTQEDGASDLNDIGAVLLAYPAQPRNQLGSTELSKQMEEALEVQAMGHQKALFIHI